ncbi:MAG: hypothetical protein HF982_07875 [Desulfobacteraceae bacterium]|nr:hypothetical protein [Desulfobacteraceae bacterium]MBC2719488.1 type VI secretion system contractile sheath large subunit [Desulfobacteraceae bacterium]
MQLPSFPFKILALAPFSLEEHAPWSTAPIRIDKTTLDQAMEDMGLSFYVSLPKDLCQAGGLTITCKRLKDFHPDCLIKNNVFLKNLLDAKKFIDETRLKGLSVQKIGARLKEWPGLPPIHIVTEHQKAGRTSTSAVDDILKIVALPEERPSSHAETDVLTAQIDAILLPILSHIFSNEKFRNLEAIWRGLRFLIQQGGVNKKLAFEVVPVSFETLDKTLNNLTTGLIHNLPSLFIIALPFDNSPRSLELLEKIAEFSQTLMVPSICWITHKFLYLDTWKDIKRLPFLPHYLKEPTFAKWRRLRKISSARWLVVTCNSFLARYPYGIDNKPRLVRFEEHDRLWASPVWAIGCLVGKSFVKTGWPTRFTEWQNIRVEDLALNTADADKPIPTETHFTEERIDQFARAGIIPLVASPNQDIAFMPVETTVAGGSLKYQSLISRLTQLLFWCKDNFKDDLEPAEIQEGLEEAFSLYWERSRHMIPTSLIISTSQSRPDNRIPIRIVIEPSRQILPSGEKVELEFIW